MASLILANTTASAPLLIAEANRLPAEPPPEVNATILRHEEAGTTDDQEYQDAVMVFYTRHVCRVRPLPEFVQRAFDKIGFVYDYTNGPGEFRVAGVIKDWDRTGRLSEIHGPTLILSDRDDVSTQEINEVLHKGIASSEWAFLEKSSHLPHVEEPELYMRTVQAFLSRGENHADLNAQ